MSTVDQARAQMELDYIHLGKVIQSTVQPGVLQKAARDFTASADNWAELRRSGKLL